jgi:hypothetical protein
VYARVHAIGDAWKNDACSGVRKIRKIPMAVTAAVADFAKIPSGRKTYLQKVMTLYRITIHSET